MGRGDRRGRGPGGGREGQAEGDCTGGPAAGEGYRGLGVGEDDGFARECAVCSCALRHIAGLDWRGLVTGGVGNGAAGADGRSPGGHIWIEELRDALVWLACARPSSL